MKGLDKVDQKDLKFLQAQKPDPNFDPEQNKRDLAWVFREHDKMVRKKEKEYGKHLEEASDATSYYLKGVEQGGRSTDVKKYFGKKHLAYLRGEEIMQKLKLEYAQTKPQRQKSSLRKGVIIS